ncbi:MAG: hypothetical protein WAU78_13130, partial [Roseiarcus sp.]
LSSSVRSSSVRRILAARFPIDHPSANQQANDRTYFSIGTLEHDVFKSNHLSRHCDPERSEGEAIQT